jgi:hypothetical protein
MANDQSMNLRVSEAFLRRLDRWRQQQPNPPTRPEAIRQICEAQLPPDNAVAAPARRKAGRSA